jgi:hypothetical protein
MCAEDQYYEDKETVEELLFKVRATMEMAVWYRSLRNSEVFNLAIDICRIKQSCCRIAKIETTNYNEPLCKVRDISKE